MNAAAIQHNWSVFLKLFSQQNRNRMTRIGVFEGEAGEMTDYWLEAGLPLAGVDVDTHGKDAPVIEIMLGNQGKDDLRHLTHTVHNARFIRVVLSASGEADGLDIENSEGTTILRFED
jgi:hypothetical protein